MLNLLGCSKENFLKLIKKMNYKSYGEEDKLYFKYFPIKNKTLKNNKKVINNNSPFNVLKEINFK
jgi:ATP-dependent RNA helicase SUPV3L1/SUV3